MKLDPLQDYRETGAWDQLHQAVSTERVWFDARTNAYYVVQYEDVARLLTNSQTLTTVRLSGHHGVSRDTQELQRAYRNVFIKWPLFSDWDYHDRLRKHLSGAFKDVVRSGSGQAREQFGRILRDADGANFDWLETVSRPLAAGLVGSLLGVGPDTAGQVIGWAVPLMDSLAKPLKTEDHMRQAIEGAASLAEWARPVLTDGDLSPFLTTLRQIATDPDLGFEAAVGTLAQIVTGAYDPTISALTVLGIRISADDLREFDSRTLCEEILRLATPFRFARRFTVEPIEVAGVRIPEKSLVFLGLATANLDARAFRCPQQFMSGRQPHLAFSRGRHYCLGAEVERGYLTALIDAMREAGVTFQPNQVTYEPELSILRFTAATGRLCRQ